MKRMLTVFSSVLMAVSVFAQENAEADAESAEPKAEAAAKPSAMKPFTTLPFLHRSIGEAEVLLPRSAEWQAVEEGRFYPLGSRYRVADGGMLELSFGPECKARIEGKGEFGTKEQALGGVSRTVTLGSGKVELDLASNLPDGAFFVTAPGFTVRNAVGKSAYEYEAVGDGDDVKIRCVTGSLALEGRHFEIGQMRAANELRIRTSHDSLETFLLGTSGDFQVKVDRGVSTKKVVNDDGSTHEVSEKGVLEWHLSPATSVRICRSLPALGERMSVAVMAYDAAGELKSNFAFSEGRAEVNSGELVKTALESPEALAKRASEATEEVSADAEKTEDAPAAGGSNE